MLLPAHLQAMNSGEEVAKNEDDTDTDTDDNVTITIWQLWMNLLNEINYDEEVRYHR